MHLTLVTCDNVKKREMSSIPPTIMLPKNAAERLTNMKAYQAQLNQELKEVQEEADHKENQHAEEVVWEKQKHEEEVAMKKKVVEAKAAWEECEQEKVRVQVTQYKAREKHLCLWGN